jgi:hypothetical protein
VALADALVESTAGKASAIDEAHLENLTVLEELPRWTAIALEERANAS